MKRSIWLLILVLAALSFCIAIVACGDDDDDDDDGDDDDDDDDDDASSCVEPDAFQYLYNECGLELFDDSSNTMSLEEAIADCNTCVIACYNETDSCHEFQVCVEQACLSNS